jgi:hypothetical protein
MANPGGVGDAGGVGEGSVPARPERAVTQAILSPVRHRVPIRVRRLLATMAVVTMTGDK